MARIITTNFQVHNAKQFVESFSESGNNAANSVYYIFTSGHVPYDVIGDGDDTNPPAPTNSPFDSYYDIYEAMIFGKRVVAGDVYHMCKRNEWTSGTVYDMYDNTDPDIADKNFFVVVAESGQHNVFKCLFNNDDGQSTSPPSLNETSADDDVYIKTSDGYQWKYMFSVSGTIFDEISTDVLMPIVVNADVSGNAVAGAIDVITVENPGSRYFSTANAIVVVPTVAGNTLIYELQSTVGANVRISSVSGTFAEEKVRFFKNGSNVAFSSLSGTFEIESVRIANVTSNATIATANIATVNSTAMRLVDESATYYTGNRIEGLSSNANCIIDTITATKVYYANAVVTDANTTWLRVTDPDGEINSGQKVETADATANADIDSINFLTSSLSSNTDFFRNMSLYVKAGTGAGQIGTISEYIVTGGVRRVLMTEAFTTPLDTTSRVEITPRVSVTGDGEGLVARAIVNTSTFSIDKIDIINRGSGYTYANATVVGNTGIVNVGEGTTEEANNAVVNVIIGPKGGHGFDPVLELYSTTVGMSVLYNDTESGNIPVDNDFRTVGILKDPQFANVFIAFTPSASFDVGETVTQQDGTGVGASGVVTSADSASINLSNVSGTFTTGGTILGANSSANGTIDTVRSNAERLTSDFTTFDQRTIFTGFTITASSFTEDNQVIQDTTLAEGRIHQSNTTLMALTRVRGDFQTGSETEVREQVVSGGSGYFTGLIQPDLIKGSGEILYIENMKPISRDSGQTERIKFYIDF